MVVTVKDLMKSLCLLVCLAVALSSSNEESTRDLIDQVLRIPNPDRVLNSVLGRLEKNRQSVSRESLSGSADCEGGLPEYTESMQMTRERGLRQLDVLKYLPICYLERKIRRLNTNEYEYRPSYYEEVRCSSANRGEEEVGSSNEICSSLGFSCVQWNKTIHLTRRRYSSDCWETRTMVIPAGCECMWPFHRLGDMTPHV